MTKLALFLFLVLAIPVSIFILAPSFSNTRITPTLSQSSTPSRTPIPTPKLTLNTPPRSKVLNSNYHVFQTFNNCGPASLSMALSYYGISVSQQELGLALRPYQNSAGDNDDKSTTLEELAEKSKDYGFIPYYRPLGNPEIAKLFITYDIPIMTRTWTKPNEDIGHYRLIKGYDETTGEFIQDDSLQGKNLRYTHADFDAIWKQFNYDFLVLIPKEKVKIAEAILGENADSKTAWQGAVEMSLKQLNKDARDMHARFNLSVAYYNVGEYQKSVEEFEKVEHLLPFRALWYQIEPIEAYYQLGNYNRVFEITDKILSNHNRAFSELYIIRGNIYKKQGNITAAKAEYEKAVLYNKNLKSAQDALNSI